MIRTQPNERLRVIAALCGLLLLTVSACGRTDEVEVHVRSIGFDSENRAPVVVLEDRRNEVALPIWIGAAEARSIAMEFEQLDAPRPMTHDLLQHALLESGVRLHKIVIESLREETYYARLYLRSLRRNFDLDARPSDAIALALRFGCPIYVNATLMQGPTVVSLRSASVEHQLTTAAGITFQNLDAVLAEVFGIDPERGGVVVTDVAPWQRSGIRRGDVILGVGGNYLRTAAELIERLAHAGGEGVTLNVRRGKRELRVGLGAAH